MAWNDFKKFMFRKKRELPEGLWMRCEDCNHLIYKNLVEEKLKTCPECHYHFSMTSAERVAALLDPGTFEELWANLAPSDPLEFVGVTSYKDKLAEAQQTTGLKDAAVTGVGALKGIRCVLGVTDSRFIMGSMGSVVGEKVTRAAEKALELKCPFVMVSGSGGGARMYEGALSLMQMAKTSAALAILREKGIPFISVLTNPTMAGVMASFAALADVIIAEPKALIGFTGPRVIQQTIKQELPEGFQRSEFLLEHGFVDMICDRLQLRDELGRLLAYMT